MKHNRIPINYGAIGDSSRLPQRRGGDGVHSKHDTPPQHFPGYIGFDVKIPVKRNVNRIVRIPTAW